MKVVKWTTADFDATNPAVTDDEYEQIYQCIIADIKEHGYVFAGDTHQSEKWCGAPTVELDDGRQFHFCASMRAWGHLMSEAWGGNYMDFYMSIFMKDAEVIPNGRN